MHISKAIYRRPSLWEDRAEVLKKPTAHQVSTKDIFDNSSQVHINIHQL